MSSYDEFAEEWNSTRRNTWGELEFFEPKKSVLDAGCGNGRLIGFLRERGFQEKYLGVDESKELLKFARQNFSAEKFELADLRNFNSAEKFNTIFCVAVLHHFANRLDQLKVLKNLQASLSASGKIFLTVWNLWQPRFFSALLKSFSLNKFRDCRIPFGVKKIPRKIFAFRKNELKKLFKLAGFRNVKIFYAQGNKKAKIFTGRNLVVMAEK
jgi:trans-aconitate methyltransferase